MIEQTTSTELQSEQHVKLSPQIKKSNLSVLEKELQKLHQKHNPSGVATNLQPKTVELIRRISRFSVVAVAETSQQLKSSSPLQLNLNSPSTSVYSPPLVFGKFKKKIKFK